MEKRVGRVYIIKNKVDDCIYIGSTIKTLNERFSKHKKDQKIKDYFIYLYMEDIGIDNFYIELLEEFENITKDDLRKKEQEYIEKYKNINEDIVLNTNNAYTNIQEYKKQYDKQYYEANKDKKKEYDKQYNKDNKDKKKQYREANKDKKKEYDKNVYQFKKILKELRQIGYNISSDSLKEHKIVTSEEYIIKLDDGKIMKYYKNKEQKFVFE